MHAKWAYILIPSFFILSFDLYSLDLYEAFSLVKENSFALKKIEQDRLSIDHRVDGLEGRFDPSLNQQLSFQLDKNKSQSPVENRLGSIYSSTVLSKKNSWGMLLKAKFDLAYSDVKSSATSFSESLSELIRSQRSINPAFDTKIEIEVSQPLYRNWLGKELSLEKEVATFENIPLRFRYQLLEQQLQYEVEILFLQYSYLLEKRSIADQLIQIREKNIQLIVARKEQGRSENLDEAREKVHLEKEKSSLLDIDVELKKVKKTIFYYLFPKDMTEENTLVPHALEKEVFALPAKTLQLLIERAFSNRIDLKENSENKTFNTKRIELIEEKQKFQLDGFVSFTANGIDNKLIDSLSQTISSKFPQFYTGVTLTMPLGDELYKNETLSEMKKRSSLTLEREQIESDIRRELDLNMTVVDTIDQQIDQLEKVRDALTKQKDEEMTKYKQARSERLLFSTYEIKFIEMDFTRLQFIYEKRKVEANIRFVCHAY